MLDWAHRHVLAAVANGSTDSSPALNDLVACGLVVAGPSPGTFELTSTGAKALELSKPSRLEWWTMQVTGAAFGFLVLGALIGRILG
jgi:hypothetical protein